MDKIIFTFLLCLTLVSCGGARTFHEYAMAGDTVAVPVGMQPTFNKENITVTITPSAGNPVILNASDPAIRAIVNLYPDPVSSMIISREINTDLTAGATGYADTTIAQSNGDEDWYQTTVFVDIPMLLDDNSPFPIGLTQIDVDDGNGISHSMTLDIISGTGTVNSFLADIIGFPAPLSLNSGMLDSLARVPHTVVFVESTGAIPTAVELNFTHDADETVGGTGKAFVVNPTGYRKALSWSDDGVNLKVILIESRTGSINDMKDFKIYITGTATNLQLTSVTGYDNNGDIANGVISATLTPN